MKNIYFSIMMILGIAFSCCAQNVSERHFEYSYQILPVDASYDSKVDPKLSKYLDKQKQMLDERMNVVIGRCDMPMVSYDPQSPLSNFLTDLLLDKGPKRFADDLTCDVALLNFGGIRTQLPQGNVTVGNIYALSPFDNYLVIVYVKGSELKKALNRFTEKKNAPFAGMQISYQNGRPTSMKIQGKPIENERVYKLITLNFISEGGDNLISGIRFEKVEYSGVIFREFLLEEIQKMTDEGKVIHGEVDNRVTIAPSPKF